MCRLRLRACTPLNGVCWCWAEGGPGLRVCARLYVRVRLLPAAAASRTELTAAFVRLMHRDRRTCEERQTQPGTSLVLAAPQHRTPCCF